jgi:hypothetical protein
LPTVTAERGYLIPAVNTSTVDYVACARRLCRSIKQFHPDASVCLLTDIAVDAGQFDHVRLLQSVTDISKWKLSNDWQVFNCSPYRETIKLEADMIAAGPIDHWWPLMQTRDVVVSTGCRDYYDQPGQSRFYRKLFNDNILPDVYNAITYWRLSQTAREFFDLVRNIFEHWEDYKTLLKFPDAIPTTDVVYAIAAVIMGPERVTLPSGLGPTIVHMKRHMIRTQTEDWTRELVWENTTPGLRIQTVAQHGLVHYYVKTWDNEQNN